VSLTLEAPAKLNLGLEVVRRRDDGYHELRSLMTAIDLHDTVTLVEGRVGLEVEGPYADPDLEPEANLVTQALDLVGALGWYAIVHKEVPAGAGLGGGSADAAAVLRALAPLQAGVRPEDVAEMAFDLGADVPFQLVGGAALVAGAGEVVQPLPLEPTWAAVAWPRLHVSTAAVFGALREDEMTDGARVEAVAEALRRGADVDLGEELPNALWAPAVRRYPELAAARDALREAGWRPRLTGTGSAMFQLCRDQFEAAALVEAAPPPMSTWVVRTAAAPALA